MRFLVDAQLPPALASFKDEDFVQRSLGAKTGPQIVWLRIGNAANHALLRWLEPLLSGILKELQDGQRIVEARR